LPKKKRKESWEETLKEDIRSLGDGWSVGEDRGKIRLKWRYVEGQKNQSVTLPFLWQSSQRKPATNRIQKIYNLTLEGHDLKTAAKIAEGKAPKIERDWSQSLANFKIWKMEYDTNIAEGTWKHDYLPVLKMAVELLESKDTPTNALDLIDLCVRDWESGSKSRTRRTNNLCQFLSYSVERENAPTSWSPPANTKPHIGRKSANIESQKVDAIRDNEILALIAGMPDTPAGIRWANAIKIMALYGLRPVELKHIHIRTDKKTGEDYLWCSYEKRAGLGVTKPRRLDPLPIGGENWNILMSLKTKLIELPPLNGKAGVGDAALKYIKKRPVYEDLKRTLAQRGERFGTVSFRHSYSVRGHQLNIDSGSVADAMGHSLETHWRAYPWASSETRAQAFQRARNLVNHQVPHVF